MAHQSLGRLFTRRGAILVAILALVVVLALAGCGGRGAGARDAGSTNQTTSGQTTTDQTSADPATAVQQGDASLDPIMAALDAASVDAAIDLSAQDTEVQP